MLLAAKRVGAGEGRNERVAADAERDDEVLRPQRDVLAVAVDLDLPLLGGLIPLRPKAFRPGPVVELHERGVVLEPVADLVLGREHGPVVGELEVGQVVVPDRVVQVQRLVALAPGVARPVVLLQDHGRYAVPLQPCAEPDPALPAADDDDVRLLGVAEGGVVGRLLLQPALPALVDLVLDPLDPTRAARLLEPLELGHRRQQRERLAVHEPQVAVAAGIGRLEVDPRLHGSLGLGGRLGQGPPLGLHAFQRRLEHVGDLVAALHGPDVPGEGHEVAPVALVREEGGHRRHVAGLQGLVERGEPRLGGVAGGGAHGCSFASGRTSPRPGRCTGVARALAPLAHPVPPPRGTPAPALSRARVQPWADAVSRGSVRRTTASSRGRMTCA